ncbi:MAG: methyltransferase domain-containing protein [Pirellulaceae bacterium]
MNHPESSGQDQAAEHNRRAWDRLVRNKQRFTRPAKDDEFHDPLKVLDGNRWLGDAVKGARLLCLAAGGGRQAPLYAAAGAAVTVVDISAEQLSLDRQVAAEKDLDIRTVQTSMDDLGMFADQAFDIVIHPVSTCYLPKIAPVYREVARITRSHGLYISQHKQPVSLQASTLPSENGYELLTPYYCESQPLPAVQGSLHREEGTLEYLHRWDQLIGEMCRAGFVIEDLTEPCHANSQAAIGTFAHRSTYVAPYVRVKARRRASAPANRVWLPE